MVFSPFFPPLSSTSRIETSPMAVISPLNLEIPFTHRFRTLFLSFLLLSFPHFPSIQSTPSSIYDHLQLNGLPIGLLPKGITDFSIDPQTNRFRVNLSQPCNAEFETQFHYDFNVSGVLSYGKIDELSGMSQQELFLWFPVKEIRVDDPNSGLIHFDVGVVDKQFSLSLFESPRDCTAADHNPSDELLEVAQYLFKRLGDKNKQDKLKATI